MCEGLAQSGLPAMRCVIELLLRRPAGALLLSIERTVGRELKNGPCIALHVVGGYQDGSLP